MDPRISKNSRLVLGTAQFGMEYGIANTSKRPDYHSVEAIISEAWNHGIREFDTAQAYGESEKVLGRTLHGLGITQEAKVISKLSPCIDHADAGALRAAVEQTLVGLGVSRLHGLMLHKEDLLGLWRSGLGKTLQAFVADHLVDCVGISVYSPSAALQALKTDGIELVQLPSNLLDRRFEDAGVFREAEQRGKAVYIRSVFLQGLLLMKPDELPERMAFAKPVMERVHAFSEKTGFSVKALALGYARSGFSKNKVVFGCETIQQLSENIQLWAETLPPEIVLGLREEFQNINEKILNPSRWNQ